MNTQKLWRSLIRPSSKHPLYSYSLRKRPGAGFPQWFQRYAGLFGLGLCAGVTLIPGTMTALLIFVFAAPFVFTLFNGTLCGLLWTTIVGQTIVKEQEQGTHDLLSTLPIGALGTHWMLGAGRLHRNEMITRVHDIVKAILIVAYFTVGLIMTINLLSLFQAAQSSLQAQAQLRAFLSIVNVFVALTILALDHVQSFVVAILVGMLAPTYANNRFEVVMWGGSVFLLLQVMTYLLFWFIGISLTQLLFDLLQIHGAYSEFGLAVTRLAVFYAIREVLIYGLWRLLTQRLNATRAEFDALTTIPLSPS